MGSVQRIGPPTPSPAVMAVLNRFNRDELGNAIEVLVSLLDVWDGDSDLEPDDHAEEDDPAGQYDEDCYTGPALPAIGAGCPIADPGGCEESY